MLTKLTIRIWYEISMEYINVISVKTKCLNLVISLTHRSYCSSNLFSSPRASNEIALKSCLFVNGLESVLWNSSDFISLIINKKINSLPW